MANQHRLRIPESIKEVQTTLNVLGVSRLVLLYNRQQMQSQ